MENLHRFPQAFRLEVVQFPPPIRNWRERDLAVLEFGPGRVEWQFRGHELQPFPKSRKCVKYIHAAGAWEPGRGKRPTSNAQRRTWRRRRARLLPRHAG